ncbi:MAG: pitrilysin family protein [Myxococcota bacterium]
MSTPPLHYQVLPNGLEILLREAHAAPVASLQIWAKVGSADEGPGEEGLAHFHEHMLFKGTERRGVGDVAGEIEGAGGRVNAYTTFDVTVYYATLPSDALDVGVDVLVDAVRHSTFDPAEVKREVEVVLEEIRRSEDAPDHVLSDLAFANAYRAHAYGRPILGSAENVASFDRAKVERFFRRWYAPDNLVVVAAGDFDARDLAARIEAAFAGAEPAGARRARASEPAQQGLRTRVAVRDFERARLDLSWRAPSFADDDATHLDLLSFVLGEAESSRLVRRVKETRGIVDRIDTSCYTPLDPGLFTVDVKCESERAAEAIEAVVEEVERVRVEPVSLAELERARANFLATESFERESVSGMASKLGHFHVLARDHRREQRYFELVRSATPDDLLRAARTWLAPEHLCTTALLARADVDALDDARAADAVARGLARATRRRAALPRRTPGRDVVTYDLGGGAELHVLPSHDAPVVAGRAAFLGGLLAETPETSGLTSFLTALWMRGTEGRSAADFARAVENLAAEVDGFSGRSSLGMTFECTSDQLAPTLDLFAEALLEPAFDEAELERERREVLAAIDRRADRIAQRAFLLFQRTLYAHHPYRMPLGGERESVAAFDVDDAIAHHERLVRRGNLAFGVAGDVDPDAVARAIASRLDALEGDGFAERWPAADPAPNAPLFAEERADREQAHYVLGFRGVAIDDADRFALELLAQVLTGQSGRLFLELRDRQSLAYSVSATNVEGLAPGFFSVYIATAPAKLAQARAGLERELARLVDEPVGEDELARAKRFLTGNHAIDRQRSAARAAHLALDARYGLGPLAALAYPEHVAALSSADVQRVARRILDWNARVEALVHPDAPAAPDVA